MSMSLDALDSELGKVQHELNHLSELSMQINDCQNEMRNIQQELQDCYDRDRKLLLDLRLKFGKKIDEAKHYYYSLSELSVAQETELKQQSQLKENQQKLDIILSEISPDITGLKSNQIKNMREKINQMKLSNQLASVQCISKAEDLAKVKAKYGRSIDITRDYFVIKEQSKENCNRLIESLNKCRENLMQYKSQYADHMSNLEEISTEIHLQRSTKNLISSRLSEPMPNCECFNIPSYDLDDDDKIDNDYSLKFNDLQDGTGNGNMLHYMSQSHNHLSQSISKDECTLPSPCKSINLPLGYSSGIIVKKSENPAWHPLL